MHVTGRGEPVNHAAGQQTLVNRRVHHVQLIAVASSAASADKMQKRRRGPQIATHAGAGLAQATHLEEDGKFSISHLPAKENNDAAICHRTYQRTGEGSHTKLQG